MRYEGDINTAQLSGNQYAARRCSTITRLTRNSIGTGSSPLGSSKFCSLHIIQFEKLVKCKCD